MLCYCDKNRKCSTNLFLLLLTTVCTAATVSATQNCFNAHSQEACSKLKDCKFCAFPGFCLPIADHCPSKPVPFPLDGLFYSMDTFEVFLLTPIDNSTVNATNLNGTWTPTQIERFQASNVLTAQFSNEKTPSKGTAQKESGSGYPRINIFWSPPHTDSWINGSLPPPNPGVFPIHFEHQLFHSQSATSHGIDVMTVNMQSNGSYLFHSLNKTFADTVAMPGQASGGGQLINVQFNGVANQGVVNCFALKADECTSQAYFHFNVPGTSASTTWRNGGVPPPPPPPPIEQCSGYVAEVPCKNATFSSGRKCAWCSSDDGLDTLCFPTLHEPSTKTWKCSV